MTRHTRRNHSPACKAKVALAAIKRALRSVGNGWRRRCDGWALRLSAAGRIRRNPRRGTRFTRISCAAWLSNGRTKCVGRYLAFYNGKRPHSSLGARTPEHATLDDLPLAVAA